MNIEQFYRENYHIVFGYLLSLSAKKAIAEDLALEENIVIKPIVIESGMAVSLDQLESGVPYIVEYRADGDFYNFNFT